MPYRRLNVSMSKLFSVHQRQAAQDLRSHFLGFTLRHTTVRTSLRIGEVFPQIAEFAVFSCQMKSARTFIPAIEFDEMVSVLDCSCQSGALGIKYSA